MKTTLKPSQSLIMSLGAIGYVWIAWSSSVFAEEIPQPSTTIQEEHAIGEASGEVQDRGLQQLPPMAPHQQQLQSKPFQLPPDLMDPYWTGLGCNSSGQATIGVKNQGKGPSGQFNMKVEWPAPQFSSSVKYRIHGLSPGSVAEKQLSFDCPQHCNQFGQCPHSCFIHVAIDVDGEVPESDETNNNYYFMCNY